MGQRRSGGRGQNVPNTRKQEALVKYIAQRLVDKPDAVTVSRRVEGSTVILELSVASGDTGRVIGKKGRVAEAIRKVMAAITHPRDRILLKIH